MPAAPGLNAGARAGWARRAKVMKTKRRGVWLSALGLGLALSAGCQTWVPEAGLTLPSPHYLQHFPTYIPPSPPYPLPRELSSLEAAAAAQAAVPPPPGVIVPGAPVAPLAPPPGPLP